MTNLHVVGSAKSVRVSFPGGESYTGIVIARDANNDIAILALRGMSAKQEGFNVNLGAQIEPGMAVHAIGYPLDSGIGIVAGQVSSATGLDQNIATAPINEGNSGGPVIDAYGNLVGIAQGGLVRRGVEAVRFGTKISAAALALGQAKLTRRFSIRVAKKQKRLTSRAIFKNFYRYVGKIEVQDASPAPHAEAPAPASGGGFGNIARLERELVERKRRLEKAKRAKVLREEIAKLKEQEDRLKARPRPRKNPRPAAKPPTCRAESATPNKSPAKTARRWSTSPLGGSSWEIQSGISTIFSGNAAIASENGIATKNRGGKLISTVFTSTSTRSRTRDSALRG